MDRAQAAFRLISASRCATKVWWISPISSISLLRVWGDQEQPNTSLPDLLDYWSIWGFSYNLPCLSGLGPKELGYVGLDILVCEPVAAPASSTGKEKPHVTSRLSVCHVCQSLSKLASQVHTCVGKALDHCVCAVPVPASSSRSEKDAVLASCHLKRAP